MNEEMLALQKELMSLIEGKKFQDLKRRGFYEDQRKFYNNHRA
jgi:hypothetical protein